MKKCLNPGEITASVTAIANMLAKDLSVNELNVMSNIFLMLGDSLAVIAAVKTFNEAICAEDKPTREATNKPSDSSEEAHTGKPPE